MYRTGFTFAAEELSDHFTVCDDGSADFVSSDGEATEPDRVISGSPVSVAEEFVDLVKQEVRYLVTHISDVGFTVAFANVAASACSFTVAIGLFCIWAGVRLLSQIVTPKVFTLFVVAHEVSG